MIMEQVQAYYPDCCMRCICTARNMPWLLYTVLAGFLQAVLMEQAGLLRAVAVLLWHSIQ
jgi:hypothetical protein